MVQQMVVPYDGVEWSLSARDAHAFWKTHNVCNSQTEMNLPDFNGDGRITKRLIHMIVRKKNLLNCTHGR